MPKELVNLRTLNKMTVKEMAQKLGISSSYYSKIEQGIRTPSYDFLLKFKRAFPSEPIEEYFFK